MTSLLTNLLPLIIMKKRPLIEVHLIILSVLFLMLLNSCKKDEDDTAVTDIDGNVYNTVTIGSQVWLKENLKTTKYNDGDEISNIKDGTAWSNLTTGAYCDFENRSDYSATYGRLYNWYAVNTGKLCPTGWHIPSADEFTTLITFLGGQDIAGGKLKEQGTSHWLTPNTGATNESKFTALPANHRLKEGTWDGTSNNGGHWWTSTSSTATNAWYYRMRFDNTIANLVDDHKTYGFSVRCLKN